MRKKISKGEVSLSINRITDSAKKESYIGLEITDNKSASLLVSIDIPLDIFALAITGQYAGQLEALIGDLSIIGKKMEVKRELIKLGKYPVNNFDKFFAKKVKPYEKDGWIADMQYCHNHHNDINGKYAVIFRRYV